MKVYPVRLAAGAERDLDHVWRYVRDRFSLEAADRFVEEIHAACLSLRVAPLRGHIYRGETREIGAAQRRVAIRFRVQDGVVTVVAIRYRGRQH